MTVLVASLARPSGNLTGFNLLTVELTAKRLELLLELVPKATVIALLVNPRGLYAERIVPVMQDSARRGRSATRCGPASM